MSANMGCSSASDRRQRASKRANEVAEITVPVLVKGKTTITNQASVAGDVADPN
jgi:hypothetical protein